jgi:hypothetical protein
MLQATSLMLLPLTLLLRTPPAGTLRAAYAPPIRAAMQAYSRGDDGGAPIDEQRVRELLTSRGELRKARNFKGADGVLAQLNGMGVSVWDREREWKVGNEPPRRSSRPGAPLDQVGERIFVTNVAYEVEWQQLRDHFAEQRPVFARVNTDSRTGKPAGNGVVQFESSTMAREAIIMMSGSTLMGRQITCRADVKWGADGKVEGEEEEAGAGKGEGLADGARPEPAWAAKMSRGWSRVAGTKDGSEEAEAIDEAEVLHLLSMRDAARAQRNFAVADGHLDELAALGVSVDDGRRQKRWWLGMRSDAREKIGAPVDRKSPRGAADAKKRAWYKGEGGTPGS